MKENNESMGTNQELTNSSENIYGLKSYTDGREMWKVMTSKWSDEEVNQAQILNDSRFEKTLAIRAIERMLEHKNGEISEELLLKIRLSVVNGCGGVVAVTIWLDSIFSCIPRKQKNGIPQSYSTTIMRLKHMNALKNTSKFAKNCLSFTISGQ